MTHIPRKVFLKALGAIVASITAWSAKGAPKAPVRALESFTVPPLYIRRRWVSREELEEMYSSNGEPTEFRWEKV